MNNKFNEKRYSGIMPTDGPDKTRIDFILNNIPDSGLKVLDIGCWDGSYAVRYKKSTNTVYGIEASNTAERRAEKKGVLTECGDFMTTDFFKDVGFDVVVAGEIIEHVFDTDLFLQKVHRLLKSHGTLFLTTPNVASLPRRILLLLGKNPLLDNRIVKDTAGHIRYFTFKGTYELLKDNGFEVVKAESDILNFNNHGTLYSTLIPKLYKNFGKTILVVAKKSDAEGRQNPR